MVTVSIMLATIMQVLDTTIANVALPHMQGSLSAGSDQITWVLTSYIVASAIMTLPVGYLAQRFGRRKLFLWSVTGFTVSSMLCGQANSLGDMIFWRLAQGIFGASLAPLSQATLLDTYPPEKHAKAMSAWGMGIMLGPILGPTLGGWLTEYYSWRWVFYVNVPVGVLSLIGIYLYVPDNKLEKRRFDVRGFALLALAVASLQMLLDRGEHVDWFDALEIQFYAIAAVLALYLFIVHNLTSDHRFLSPALFRDRNFVSGTLFIFFIGIVLLATMALLPTFLQQWKGYPVMTTGLVLMPRGVGTLLTMWMVGRLMQLVDARLLVLIGLGLVSFSLHIMAGFNLQVSAWELVYTGFVQGLGLGLLFVPVSILAYATLQPRLRGEATALFSLSRNLGSSVGVSIVMAALTRNIWINQQELGARMQVSPDLFSSLPSTPEAMAMPFAILQELTRQAAEIAYVNNFQLLSWITLVAMPLILLLAKPKAKDDAGPTPAH
ncbi:MAG: DHA2 family efflux MFS transporter permease subunit [Pseudomonadales bacterium]|nr:DHA2 family efflux MFS transporter permease subunit [Pseudomonadales bacterium]